MSQVHLEDLHDREVAERRKWAAYTVGFIVVAAFVLLVLGIAARLISFTVR
jgi:hypothetical protein